MKKTSYFHRLLLVGAVVGCITCVLRSIRIATTHQIATTTAAASSSSSSSSSSTAWSSLPRQQLATPATSDAPAAKDGNNNKNNTSTTSDGVVVINTRTSNVDDRRRDYDTSHQYEADADDHDDDAPWANLTNATIGYFPTSFKAGYRNQIMALSAFVMEAASETGCGGGSGCSQIIHTTLQHRDSMFGRGATQFRHHAAWFDVRHWNTYYPRLPRMVSCDPAQFTDFDCDKNQWRGRGRNKQRHQWRRPYASPGPPGAYFKMYRQYLHGHGPFATPAFPNPVDLLMIQGALRPHPDLMAIVDQIRQKLRFVERDRNMWNANDANNTAPLVTSSRQQQQQERQQQEQPQQRPQQPQPQQQHHAPPYMALHARVEPDMQRHPHCRAIKLTRLRDVIDLIYTKWPRHRRPPHNIQHVFIPIHRQLLEEEGGRRNSRHVPPHPSHHPTPNSTNTTTNWIAIENLQLLNALVANGMWNGTVSVFEGGASAVAGTRFAQTPTMTGAMIDFELAIHARIFLGTEISTWSHDLLNTRFYRNTSSINYRYRPNGIEQWTSPNETIHPPPFNC